MRRCVTRSAVSLSYQRSASLLILQIDCKSRQVAALAEPRLRVRNSSSLLDTWYREALPMTQTWTSLRRVLAIVCLLSATGAPLWAQNPPPPPPAPSSTSTVGATVTNPVTGLTTTVSALRVDPAGTPTAGTTAFVRTADGYAFLVKAVGQTIYNDATPPLGFVIISI